jgi:hypothetical protein
VLHLKLVTSISFAKSKNLKDWKTEGYVFNKLPEWQMIFVGTGNILRKWKVYVYYAAHKKGGETCALE